jgi:hypothetical protein
MYYDTSESVFMEIYVQHCMSSIKFVWMIYRSTHTIFHFIGLLVPPPREECNLNVDEGSIWINKKLLDDTVQDELNGGVLDAVVS